MIADDGRKPTPPDKPLREWRVSIVREKVHYLGRVVATDKESAIDKHGGIPDRARAAASGRVV